jgi:rhodanese-related sulfurtransferase
MQQKDKNIFIGSIFVVIFLFAWVLTKYDSAKKEHELLQQEITNSENDNVSENSVESKKALEKKSIIPVITPQKIQSQSAKDNVILIDTRSVQNFNNSHIKNSIHINDIDLTKQPNKTLIFITLTGDEDSLLGYYRDFSDTNQIYNLLGGFNNWLANGYSTISQTIEHTFENNSKVNFVEPRDLNALISTKQQDTENNNVVIIDTRRPGNYEKGHITHAINIPFEDLENRYSEIPTGKKIYIYGHTNESSFASGVLLYELGFIGAKTIKGGLMAWQEYNYPIVQK